MTPAINDRVKLPLIRVRRIRNFFIRFEANLSEDRSNSLYIRIFANTIYSHPSVLIRCTIFAQIRQIRVLPQNIGFDAK